MVFSGSVPMEGASFDEETETGTAGQVEAAMTITASYQTTNPLD